MDSTIATPNSSGNPAASSSTDSQHFKFQVREDPNQVFPRLPPEIALPRRRFGYVLLVVSILIIVITVIASLQCVDGLRPLHKHPSTFDYIKLSVHGVITVVFMFFCYGLLQAAERMAIPSEWVRTTDDLRLLLGVKPPTSLVVEDLKTISKILRPNSGGTKE